MGCLSGKIDGNIEYTCESGITGVEQLMLLNKSDILGIAFAGTQGLVTITFAVGAHPIHVDGRNKAMFFTEALRVNENSIYGLEQSINFTMYAKDPISVMQVNEIVTAGNVVACAKLKGSEVYRVLGPLFGLQVTAVDENSNENGGFTTITMATPSGVVGEQRSYMTKANFVQIYNLT